MPLIASATCVSLSSWSQSVGVAAVVIAPRPPETSRVLRSKSCMLVEDAGPVEDALLLRARAVRERAVHATSSGAGPREDPRHVVGEAVGVARAARRPALAALRAVRRRSPTTATTGEVEPLAALGRLPRPRRRRAAPLRRSASSAAPRDRRPPSLRVIQQLTYARLCSCSITTPSAPGTCRSCALPARSICLFCVEPISTRIAERDAHHHVAGAADRVRDVAAVDEVDVRQLAGDEPRARRRRARDRVVDLAREVRRAARIADFRRRSRYRRRRRPGTRCCRSASGLPATPPRS